MYLNRLNSKGFTSPAAESPALANLSDDDLALAVALQLSRYLAASGREPSGPIASQLLQIFTAKGGSNENSK